MIDSNRLKQGVKVTFGGKADKIVNHICYDHGRIGSVSFTDGTILDWHNSLWELAELAEPSVIWEDGEYGGQYGYESERHRLLSNYRFSLEASGRGLTLTECIDFPSEDTAKIYADKRLKLWRSSCGH